MRSLKWIAMSLAAAAFAGGCQQQQQAINNDDFQPDDGNRLVWRAMEQQCAAGAAEDGMLYASHFEGSELNDLGRDKLDLMVRTTARPLVVYVNAPGDAQAAREQAVTRFLSGAGVQADAMAVKAGANPAATGHAAEGLAKMWKTESPGPVAASSDGEGSSQTNSTNGTGTTAQ